MAIFSNEFEASLSILIKKLLQQELSALPKHIPKDNTPLLEENFTRHDAAKYLNVCITTIHNYVKKGKIKTHRIGNRVLIKKSDLEASISPVVFS